MGKENFWLVCEHILTGSANEIMLRIDKMALCKLCAVKPPVKDLQAVYESQVMRLIKGKVMVSRYKEFK